MEFEKENTKKSEEKTRWRGKKVGHQSLANLSREIEEWSLSVGRKSKLAGTKLRQLLGLLSSVNRRESVSTWCVVNLSVPGEERSRTNKFSCARSVWK